MTQSTLMASEAQVDSAFFVSHVYDRCFKSKYGNGRVQKIVVY